MVHDTPNQTVTDTAQPGASNSFETAGFAPATPSIEVGTAAGQDNSSTFKIAPEPSRTVCHIQKLPNELLSNIFENFDVPKPSDFGLNDEPTFDLTDSKSANLKSISRVTKRWRNLVIPVLFNHARLNVSDSKTQRPILNRHIAPFFDFVNRHSLRKFITSFTLLVRDKKIAIDLDGEYRLTGFSSFWYSLFKIIDPIELLIVAHPTALGPLTACHVVLTEAWNFDCPCHYLRLQRPAASALASSTVVEELSAVNDSQDRQAREPIEPIVESPQRSNVVAASTRPFVNSNDSHSNVTLTGRHTSDTGSSSDAAPLELWELPRGDSSPVFDIRSWTTLLLNEGSFIRAYSTYEFWLRQPPSVGFEDFLRIVKY
jgi:hypothetical protein